MYTKVSTIVASSPIATTPISVLPLGILSVHGNTIQLTSWILAILLIVMQMAFVIYKYRVFKKHLKENTVKWETSDE